MAETALYTISLTTDFKEWSRYNVFMMGSCRDVDGTSSDFVHLISKGSTDGNSFAPSTAAHRHLQLATPECAAFDLYIYVVANTLPSSRIIGQCPPFEVQLRICANGNEVYAKPHTVNQWGGATIYIEFPRK